MVYFRFAFSTLTKIVVFLIWCSSVVEASKIYFSLNNTSMHIQFLSDISCVWPGLGKATTLL